MGNEIKCVIFEDDYTASLILQKYIHRHPDTILCDALDSPKSWESTIKNTQPDLIFLDIQMPHMLGTDLAKALGDRYLIIFTSSFVEYAVESYEIEALDYLLKPYDYERFEKAIERALKQLERQSSSEHFMTIKSGYDLIKIDLRKLLYVEGMKEYVAFHLQDDKIISYMALKDLIEILPANFLRIHRSYIANTAHIKGVSDNLVDMGKDRIPVSRANLKAVKNSII